MTATADDYSPACWPRGSRYPSQIQAAHERCDADLMDFSDPAKMWAYCACHCHHRADLPGFVEYTSGRCVEREMLTGI